MDQMKPFGCQLIVDIIEAQWFPSTSRSKLDLETTNKIYERRDLPLNVLLLSVTAVSITAILLHLFYFSSHWHSYRLNMGLKNGVPLVGRPAKSRFPKRLPSRGVFNGLNSLEVMINKDPLVMNVI